MTGRNGKANTCTLSGICVPPEWQAEGNIKVERRAYLLTHSTREVCAEHTRVGLRKTALGVSLKIFTLLPSYCRAVLSTDAT